MLFRPISILFILSTLNVFCQNRAIDSLESVLKTTKEDTVRAKVLDDLCWEYNQIDPEKSGFYAEQLLDLSQKIGYQKGEGNAYANLGAVHYLQSNYEKAIYYFSQAKRIRKEAKDKAGVGGVLNNIAMSEQQKGNYTAAVTNYIEALTIFEDLKDEARAAQANNNIGSVYTELKNYKLANEYTMKGLEGWKKLNNPSRICGSYVNLGNNFHGMKNYPEAIKNYEIALTLAKPTGNKYALARIYHNLGAMYNELKQYDKAIEYVNLEIPLKTELGDKEGIASAHHSLGKVYLTTGKKELALREFQKMLELAKEIQSKDNMRWAYLGLKETYWALGNLEEALKYGELHDVIKDSIYTESSAKQIAEMQTKFETEKKEKENSELKRKTEVQRLEIENEAQKRKIQLVLGISILLLAGAAVVFYYNRRKMKQEALHAAELAIEEKKRFKAIIDAEEAERSRISQELHDGLGQLLSTARLNVAGLEDSVDEEDRPWLDKSLKIIDEACVEVRHISHNMMPSALIRLGLVPAIQELVNNVNAAKKIKVDLVHNINTSIEKSIAINIYRIVQETLNNMIKHAQADHIKIELTKNKGRLEISMQDDGVGFDVEKIKESKGMGWKNIYSRVSMANGNIVVNSESKKGTSVFIKIELYG
jgi:signal transduction histidine kinase